MLSITRATVAHSSSVSEIGALGVEEAHRDSCSAEDMNEFLKTYYNEDAIRAELSDAGAMYHVLNHDEKVIGFSKIILNAEHANIGQSNITKLDRIYLLKAFHGQKLGLELLNFNIELAKNNNQAGMWLFTWKGNQKAVDFYLKAGFKVIGSHKFKVTETHYNEHHQMFLDLNGR